MVFFHNEWVALDLRFGALLSTCTLYDCSIDTLIQYLSSSRLYRSVEASTRGRSALVCSRQPRQISPVNCQALINTTLSNHKCNHKAKAKVDLHCNPIIPPPLHPILTSRFRDTLSYSCASFRLSTRDRGYAMQRNAWGAMQPCWPPRLLQLHDRALVIGQIYSLVISLLYQLT